MSISIKATMPSYCTLCFKQATKWPLNSPVSILVSHFGDKSVRYIIYFVVLRIESVRTILALQLSLRYLEQQRTRYLLYALRSNPSNLPKSLSHSDSTDCQIQKRSATGGKTSISDMYLNRRVLTWHGAQKKRQRRSIFGQKRKPPLPLLHLPAPDRGVFHT